MSKILLIEPDRLLAKIYHHTLMSAGHKVQVCATAQSGVFSADETRPDMILLELQLVEHSGIEFLYEFRSYPDWQNIPVIILSHVPPSEFKAYADIFTQQLGVSTYLYKPLTSLRTLLATVQQTSAAVLA